MRYRIGIGDLAANALIETIEHEGKRTVSFSQLDKYGKAIVACSKKEGIEAVLVFDRDETIDFMSDHADMFDVAGTSFGTCVSLRDNFSTADLRKRFRTNIALDLMKIFASEEVKAALLN